MKSKQINFFLTPEDVQDINEYLKENNLLILPNPIPKNEIILVDSLLARNLKSGYPIRGQKFIFREQDRKELKIDFISNQKYYSLEITNSPAIEFLYPLHEEKSIRSGRIYFVKDKLNPITLEQNNKKQDFLKTADEFFNWFRKKFKNIKLSGYEGYHISPRAAEWKEKTGGNFLTE